MRPEQAAVTGSAKVCYGNVLREQTGICQDVIIGFPEIQLIFAVLLIQQYIGEPFS